MVVSKKMLYAFVTVLLVLSAAVAQNPAAKPEQKAESPGENLFTTAHSVTVGGSKLTYKATAGTLPLKDDDGKVTANVFFIAYTKEGTDLRTRPITFAFNGGPGSSAVWLHLGAFGPRRVEVGDVGESVSPPYKLVENEATLLDLTDLVFVDPVTTGFSRAAAGQNPNKFHGVQEDIQSVGEFVRLYVTRFNRWPSPKFLAGESYGTTRAAGLVNYLQDRSGMNFNGVILVSAVLNFGTVRFDDGNDLPFALFLPSYTATAWYHKKLPADLMGDLNKTLLEVEKFAQGEYTVALMKGSRLSTEERRQVALKLARYTGLSEDYVERTDLRIEIGRFRKELLRKEGQTVGRYDSRFKAVDADSAGEHSEFDPSYVAVQGPYTATLNQYLRTELKYEKDLHYEILTGRVQPWDYGNAKNRYLNMSNSLRQAMTKNRDLRVFVANGYMDLATPYFGTEYTFDHLGVEPKAAERVTMGYYEAGHMMYVNKKSLEKLKTDLAKYYAAVLVPANGAKAAAPSGKVGERRRQASPAQ